MNSIRDEIGWIANEIQSTSVQARETAGDLAKRLEELFRSESSYDTSIADMDDRYVWREASYMWTTEPGEQGSTVIGATGLVPVDDGIKRELRLWEHMLPSLREEYTRNRYTDEVIYCDKRSMVVGQTTTNFAGLFPSGFDSAEVCRSGVTYYDYYGWVDPTRQFPGIPPLTKAPCAKPRPSTGHGHQMPLTARTQLRIQEFGDSHRSLGVQWLSPTLEYSEGAVVPDPPDP